MNPPATEVTRFRELAAAYGSEGYSWWSWQSAGPRALAGLTLPLNALAGVTPAPPPALVTPTLRRGARGDVVRLAQRRLGMKAQTGYFGPDTKRAVRSFQAQRGLPKTGALDPPTWSALPAG
jgi:peptidoglycan hydrolase-like protein with peptidoglycan-binding domain